MTRLAPSASSARVRPPGPGPISMMVAPSSGTCGACDPRGEVEVEQEVLAEGFACRQGMFANDVAQRRQIVDRAHEGLVVAIRAASRKAAARLDGLALPVPAMSKAVPWSGEVRMNGNPSVTLTASSNAIVLIGISAWS